MTVVTRPDLSQRTALSKSVLVSFDLCNHKAWHAIHYPRPFVPKEVVTFGSAVDAGAEVLIKYARMGEAVDLDRAMAAAEFIIERDGIEVDRAEVRHALTRFVVDVLPLRDWSKAKTQETLRAAIEDLGDCEGHPDVLLPGEVVDIKTSKAKSAKDPRSVELGFYVLLREWTGEPVTRVTYIEWRRGAPVGSLKEGKWVVSSFDVTQELRRWTLERARAVVRAKKADDLINAKATTPINASFPNGPRFPSLCDDCEWADICPIRYREEASDDFAA